MIKMNAVGNLCIVLTFLSSYLFPTEHVAQWQFSLYNLLV